MNQIHETNIAGRPFKVEFGKVGMLSDAAIFMSYGDTVILTNVNASEQPREGIDFFPLSVEYEVKIIFSRKNSRWIFKERRKAF